jgi:hypothetical protein
VSRSRTSLGRWGAVGCAAAVLAAIAAAQTSPGQTVLRDAGLVAHAERYTELSFRRPSRLPTTLPAGQRRVTLSWSLRNAEGARRDYAWTIEARDAGGRQVLGRGTTSAGAGQRVTVRQQVEPRCRGPRTRVEVHLARPDESIGFWAQCS